MPEDRQIWFRIGINLGDIIIEDDDIHGDGVNVAARLEGLAEPGGICVSRTVRNHVQDKLSLAFEDLGERTLKNIPRPVHVFRVVPDGAPVVGERGASRRHPVDLGHGGGRAPGRSGGAGLWLRSDDAVTVAPQQAVTPGTTEATGDGEQAPLDKHRIAVLPFANISADPEDEYFADGMTEELISKFSRLHDLSVIARTSVMQYKETGKSVAEIGRELQVGTNPRGQRAQGRRPPAHHRPIDRRGQPSAPLVGGLRPRPNRRVRDLERCRRACRQGPADHPQAHRGEAAREGGHGRPGGVQRLSQGPLPLQHMVEGGSGEEYLEYSSSRRSRAIPTSPKRTPPWLSLLRYAGRFMAIYRRTKAFQK